MVQHKKVVYDNFSGGEYGHLGGAKAPENSWTGRNVHVYRTGLIGPRPGLKATAATVTSGNMKNIWWTGSGTEDYWWVTDTGVVQSSKIATGTVVSLTGSIMAPTGTPQAVDIGLGQWILTNLGDTSYLVDHAASTVTAITDAPGGLDIAIYGERVFIANSGSPNYFRVYYSEAADFSNWPAGNFFDVGHTAGIAAIEGQRDHLAIILQDGSWWVSRGFGNEASLRKITSPMWYPWIVNPNAVSSMPDGTIALMGPVGDWPLSFDGANVEEYRNAGPAGDLLPYTNDSGIRVLPARRSGETLIVRPISGGGALLAARRDATWSLYTTTSNVAAVSASTLAGLFVLTDPLTSSFWTLDLRIDHPAFTSDQFGRPGDLSDTPLNAYFTLPEWWAPEGYEVRARQIVIDFVKFNTGSSTANNITCTLSAFGLFNNDGTESAAAQSFNEAGASASTTGVRDRLVMNIGEQGFGAGFQVALTALKGVAINRITVDIETQPAEPRL